MEDASSHSASPVFVQNCPDAELIYKLKPGRGQEDDHIKTVIITFEGVNQNSLESLSKRAATECAAFTLDTPVPRC